MRRMSITLILVLIMALIPLSAISETIDVHIKGVDDGLRTNKQQDYKEAVMNAKLQAVERGGVEIRSITKVEDFQIKYDLVESKASAVLLPGFKVIDVGYLQDGTYQIVLIGKVSITEESIDSKELRYAQAFIRRGKKSQAKKIIENIISSIKDDVAVSEAMYYQVLWNFSSAERDTYDKLKAYYPNSKYVSRLETLLAEREAERESLQLRERQNVRDWKQR